MQKLALAIAVAAQAFKNKTDKGGHPYILHCLYVMDNTPGDDCVKCAAVLHDVPEDTEITISDLAKMGFSEKTIGLLYLVTHNKETPYQEYIKAIAVNKDATEIKKADLRHNSDITRLKGLRKKDIDRIEKYHWAYMYLSN